MRNTILATLAAVLALAFVATSWSADDKADQKKIEMLIRQLGSDSFDDRQTATRELEKMGKPALDQLKKATESADLEIALRAKKIIEKIEKGLASRRVLTPLKVKLAYKNAPIAEVIADLAKKTGFTLQLEGVVDRKVTVETDGEVPFWEAWDLLIQKTGLVERVTVASPQKQNNGGGVVTQVIIINGNIVTPPQQKEDPQDGRIILTDGKSPVLPSHYAGPLRLRMQPPGTAVPNVPKVEGEAILGLEITAEPRLLWQRVINTRITRAKDDEGQELTQVVTANKERQPQSDYNRRGMVIINGQVMNQDDGNPANPRQAGLRLKLGEKKAKTLTEISGVVSGQVLLPPEPLITIDDVLKSAGKTVEGPEGSSLKVVEATREDSGLVRMRLMLETPTTDLSDGTQIPFMGTVVINGRVIGGPQTEPLGTGYVLLDEKGEPFELQDKDSPAVRLGAPREVKLTFLQKKNNVEAKKLIYVGRRGMIVDVPFTLKDVPLP